MNTRRLVNWGVALLALGVAASTVRAQTPISALPAGAAITGNEAVPAVQSAATVRTTPSAIVTYARTTIAPGSAGQMLYSNGSGVLTASSTIFDTSNGKLISTQGGADFPGFKCANGTTSVASCEFLGGDGTTTAGTARMRGGASSGVGNAGAANVIGGAATNGNGGSVLLVGGAGGTNGNGGAATMRGGAGAGTGVAGALNFETGVTSRLVIQADGSWDLAGTTPGTTGQVLTSQGANAAPIWAAAGSGTPAGANTQVQFNNAGAFGASSNFAWDNTNRILTVGGATDGTVASASGVPLTVGPAGGTANLVLRASGTTGEIRFNVNGAQRLAIIDNNIVASAGSNISTTSGNIVANSGGFFGRSGSSVSSLAFTFNDDGNTGLYGAANDSINFGCGGANCGTVTAASPLGNSLTSSSNWTGCASSPTNNIKMARNGVVVTIGLDAALSCTSNGTTFVSLSTLGTLYRPVADVVFTGLQVTDNGTNRPGCVRISASAGTIELGLYDNTTGACSFNTWTNTGAKAFLVTGERYWTYTAH